MVVSLSKTAKNVEMKSEEDVPFLKRFVKWIVGSITEVWYNEGK